MPLAPYNTDTAGQAGFAAAHYEQPLLRKYSIAMDHRRRIGPCFPCTRKDRLLDVQECCWAGDSKVGQNVHRHRHRYDRGAHRIYDCNRRDTLQH